MDHVQGDLQVKYQKIASEYSKVRAQIGVLKKAVVEEQSRNAELRDLLKEREQSLRKAAQEVDSLAFRNQQLERRVAVLQEEFEIIQIKSKKGKNKGDQNSVQSTSQLIDEELQNKITENARLLSTMHDKDHAYRNEMDQLKIKLEELESELAKQQKNNNEAEKEHKARVESERAASDAEVRWSDTVQQIQNQHTARTNELTTQLLSCRQALNEYVPSLTDIVNSGSGDLPALNVPRHDRAQHVHASHVANHAATYVANLTSALADWHTCVEQRLGALWPGHLSSANARLSQHLKTSYQPLERVASTASALHQALVNGEGLASLGMLPALVPLAESLEGYRKHLDTLLPYHSLSLEEESSLATSVDGLTAANTSVFKGLEKFTHRFGKLTVYCRLLAMQNQRSCQHPPPSQRRFLLEVVESLKGLYEAVKELHRASQTKSNIEHALPTCSTILRSSDEGAVKALASALTALGQLSNILAESRPELWRGTGTSAHPLVLSYRHRAANFLNSLQQDEPKSVPWAEALSERAELHSETASRAMLGKQLEQCQNRASQLEQESEKWRLETQLLKLRHKKEIDDLESRLKGDKNGIKKDDSADPRSLTNMLGSIDEPFSLSREIESREELLKQYMTKRVHELIEASQQARSQATALSVECEVLEKRLAFTHQTRQEAESKLNSSQDILSALREELRVTTDNYKSQLAVMSEHVAVLNDQLALQREEIDQLTCKLNAQPQRSKFK